MAKSSKNSKVVTSRRNRPPRPPSSPCKALLIYFSISSLFLPRAAVATTLLNFNASEDFARLIARLARDAGSTRRLIARWAREAGYDVSEADLNPVDNRRRWTE
jgi:hypothetical protein